jgi:hypothetical protein
LELKGVTGGFSIDLNGGTGNCDIDGVYKVDGVQVVGARVAAPPITTKTAGGTYTANEQAMLNELKADIAGIHTALGSTPPGHGLWT